jgi:serine/threonine protein kinase/tetratricopeptide (TPR) repeat protein
MNDLHPIQPVRGGSGAIRVQPALTPERWRKIKEIFSLALEREPSERAAFLNEACKGDDWLRSEVESLLQSSESEEAATREVFKAVSSQPVPPALEEVEDPLLGRRVGDYRIERRIGYGGMAAVYLASRADEQFQMHAAVKLLRPDLDRAELLRRFLNERQTLAALDHPNIVKLLDGGSTEEGLPYLVMDYVEGVPIDDYCDAHRLSIQERLQLFCTVCDAVSYAHRHHVVHRDLKPNNILVTGGGVPKLLDFGISKVLDPVDRPDTNITRTATRHLTPAYASPEQVRGERVGAITDVYSLGVVLYELLTGHRPYRLKQRTPAAVEHAICEQEPESPSTAVDRVESESRADGTVVTITAETVSRTREGQPSKLRHSLQGDLDNIVLKALQKDAQRRYESVAEFARDIQRHLDHHPVQARPNTLSYRTSKFIRRRKTEAIAIATVLIVVAGAVGVSIWHDRIVQRSRDEVGIQRTGGRRAIAVLGFKNLSARSDLAWLSTALSEMLTTELAAGGELRLISGEDVAQTRASLALPEADSFGAATLHRIYKNLGSDYIVSGSYVETGEGAEQVRLDFRLQDAIYGDTIAAVAESGSRTDLPELVARVGTHLRHKLGIAAPSTNETSKVHASQPSSMEGAQFYALGLEKKRVYDMQAARDLFEKAVVADPSFPLAHLALSETWFRLGDNQRSRDEAKKALDLSAGLPREESLMIEARYYETLHQWDKAIDLRRTLFNFFPDSLEHGLNLVTTQATAAMGNEGLTTIDALRKLPEPERSDPRIDLAESTAANVVSDYKRQAAAAERAIEKGRAIGARLLVADAQNRAARAYLELGQKDKVGPALSEAAAIYSSVGDRFHQARILQQVGLAYFYQGKMEEAKKTYLDALEIQRNLGNRTNQAKLLNGIAMVLHHENDPEGARQTYLEALAICKEIDDRAMTGTILGNLGGIEFELGDLQNAQDHLQQSLTIARQGGDQSGVALQLENLALVLVAQGNLRGAMPLYDEGLQISRKTGKNKDLTTILFDRGDLQLLMGQIIAAQRSYEEAQQIASAAGDELSEGVAVRSLGEIQFEGADLLGARHSYEQSRALLEKTGEKEFVEDVRMALAELDLEDGHATDAERGARLAADEFRKAHAPENLAMAETLLASTLLAQHRAEDAQGAAADALKNASKGSRTTQFGAAVVAAEVETASGKANAAAHTLKQLVTDSHKAGFVVDEFKARLALGQAEIRMGSFGTGQSQLASLEHDATAKGFLLIARRAHTAKARHSTPSSSSCEDCKLRSRSRGLIR